MAQGDAVMQKIHVNFTGQTPAIMQPQPSGGLENGLTTVRGGSTGEDYGAS